MPGHSGRQRRVDRLQRGVPADHDRAQYLRHQPSLTAVSDRHQPFWLPYAANRYLAARIGADVVAKFLAQLILNENPIGAESGGHGDFQSVGCVGHLIG